MTTPTVQTTTPDDAPAKRLGARLVRAATSDRDRIAAQALAEERTVLAVHQVESALLVMQNGRNVLRWEGLMGKLYTLPLDPEQRCFLGLVLSMVGIGSVTIAAVAELDPERLRVIIQAMLRLAGDDSIAIGTRI